MVLLNERWARQIHLCPCRDAARESGGFVANCRGSLLDDEKAVGRRMVDFEVDTEASAVGTFFPANDGKDGFIVEEPDALHLWSNRSSQEQPLRTKARQSPPACTRFEIII